MRGLLLFIVFLGLLPMILKQPFVGILMWFLWSLMNPQRLVYGFGASINYAMIIAIVTIGSWLLLHPEEPKVPPRDRVTFLLILLMIWITITSLTGFGPPNDIFRIWSEAEKMLLMTLVAYAMTNTRERFNLLVLICVLSVAYFGFAGGIFTIVRGGVDRVYGPAGSMIADNNDLGVALTMNLPLLFYVHQRYSHTHFKWPLRVLIGLVILGDLFTYSRGALVAVTAMGATLWLRTRNKIVTGVVIVIAVIGILNFAPKQWFERMGTIQTYREDGSAESRLWMWQVSWIIASQHPITGAGFKWGWNWNWVNQKIQGSGLALLDRPRAPHSIWFDMLSCHGFVGLVLLLVIFIVAVANGQWLIRRTRGDPDLVWANNFGRMYQVAFVGFAVGGSFATLDMYDGFYILVIMGAIARRIVAAELSTRNRVGDRPLADTLPAAAAAQQARLHRPLVRT